MIDFQFLRDCVTALKEVQTGKFYMGSYVKDDPEASNNWCGTPACVLGHWLVREMGKVPIEERRFEPMPRMQRIMSDVYVKYDGVTVHGLDAYQMEALFSGLGCGGAKTKEQAIAYIHGFILRHGGSIEDPKPLVVAIVPDWNKIAIEAKPGAVKEVV